MKQIYIFLSILLLASCKPSKSVIEYRYVSKMDTIVKVQTNHVYDTVNDTILIDNPCDSTGILNRFYSKIAIPFGQVVAKNKGKKLQVVVNTKKLVVRDDSTYKSKNNEYYITKEKEIKVPYTPQWLIYSLLATSVLSFLYIREKVSIFVK